MNRLQRLNRVGFRLAIAALAIGLAACSTQRSSSDAAAFVPAPWPAPDPCGMLTLADVQTVSPGVGSEAAYIDDVGRSQSIFARVKSYRVGITASGVATDVPEALLLPLAVKVVGQL